MKTIGQLTVATPGASTLALSAVARSRPRTNVVRGILSKVRINDRGPFTRNRIIDLSESAAVQLGMIADGVANLRVSRVKMS
jgi:rare lipoprotein A